MMNIHSESFYEIDIKWMTIVKFWIYHSLHQGNVEMKEKI